MCSTKMMLLGIILFICVHSKLTTGSDFLASPTTERLALYLIETQQVKSSVIAPTVIAPTVIAPTVIVPEVIVEKVIEDYDWDTDSIKYNDIILTDACELCMSGSLLSEPGIVDNSKAGSVNVCNCTDDNSSPNSQTLELSKNSSYRKLSNIEPLEITQLPKLSKVQENEKVVKKQPPKTNVAYTHTTRVKGRPGANNLSENKSFGARKSKNIFSYRDLIFSDIQPDKLEENFDVLTICKSDRTLILPHPDNCARYINCSATPDAAMLTYFSGYIYECPYPQLFSEKTHQCEDFINVRCVSRFEPKSPCEYRMNKCHVSSHCVPCWVRYASCRGLNEGLNPWEGMEWEPFFVECHKERTVFQGQCDSSAVFSPITRACETPMSIPSKHGGWKPGCLGRRDGFYADELGRCDLYYKCKNQLFRGFHSCPKGFKFSPITSSCDDVKNVPFPCGDKIDETNVCQGKEDGLYLDIFGRCTHYFACRNESMAGFHVCSKGVFNVEKGRCDTVESARMDMSMPCGDLDNTCLHRSDGVYLDRDGEKRHCARRVVCEKGLTIAKRVNCNQDKF